MNTYIFGTCQNFLICWIPDTANTGTKHEMKKEKKFRISETELDTGLEECSPRTGNWMLEQENDSGTGCRANSTHLKELEKGGRGRGGETFLLESLKGF
jgi:hypothetical protein